MCNGICNRYKAKKLIGVGRYQSGQFRCQGCEIYLYWKGNCCPCCHMKLRKTPRALKYKKVLRHQREAGDTLKFGVTTE